MLMVSLDQIRGPVLPPHSYIQSGGNIGVFILRPPAFSYIRFCFFGSDAVAVRMVVGMKWFGQLEQGLVVRTTNDETNSSK